MNVDSAIAAKLSHARHLSRSEIKMRNSVATAPTIVRTIGCTIEYTIGFMCWTCWICVHIARYRSLSFFPLWIRDSMLKPIIFVPGSCHGFNIVIRIFLKFCIQNLFFGKLVLEAELLHTDCRPIQGRWIYNRGVLSLWAANSLGSSLHRRPLETWWVFNLTTNLDA